MTTKNWQGPLFLLALAGCTVTNQPATQPIAASAGNSSQSPVSGGAGSVAAVGGAPTKPVSGASGTAGMTPQQQQQQQQQQGSAGQTAPVSQDLDDAGSDQGDTGAAAPLSGETVLSADLVVPAGTTMRVAAGSSFKASTDVKVQVLGELIVQGSAESPVTFAGGGVPRSWHGIVVESGGKLTLENAHVSGAYVGLYIMPGAEFSVDSSVIDTSFKAAVVQSNGSFTRTRFIASVPETVSLASEVTVDDPNGALTIMDASPTITDCQFDGASSLTDLVRIGGVASPVFDHVYLHDAHCAFHTFGGTNTSAIIRHTRMQNFAYAFMAYTTKPIVEDSVFITNSSDFGICLGATEDNAPVLRNNYYSGGEVLLDPSCFNIGIVDASPASADDPSIGTISTFQN